MNSNKTHFGLSNIQLATAIAIIFHSVGLIGILFFKDSLINQAAALNLLLMFILICLTQSAKNFSFWMFILISVLFGFIVEIIGTSTGLLFGDYAYGRALGPKLFHVPLIIGINWFIVMYSCGISIEMLRRSLSQKTAGRSIERKPILKKLAMLIDGATLAVAFDWIIEPVAIKLDYWRWLGDGKIPDYNYACWFFCSVILLLVFQMTTFEKRNKFAVHLLLIQVMFFLILRTFL
jgi:putative membrane protein